MVRQRRAGITFDQGGSPTIESSGAMPLEYAVMQQLEGLASSFRDLISVNLELCDALKAGHPTSGGGITFLSPENRRDMLLFAAKGEYKGRRQRDSVFSVTGLLADPGWDILLDLFISRLENKTISITSACIASCVPSTTALRWITVLEKESLVYRSADKRDKRRQNVDLSDDGFAKMAAYFEEKIARALQIARAMQ
ncbi:hypothetical protein [Novosphingobium sp. FSW06-99]|uniref:hypothetical protein n=1 Tax=Novosphingobium sp. FSW06-99 TaxID=1739113 RepID=UPI0012E360E5|nr:hypothetical protein [Novosphingobium sp. FSW06-99]